MTNLKIVLLLILVLALILLTIILILSPYYTYQKKNSVFVYVIHLFLGQNRTQFSISLPKEEKEKKRKKLLFFILLTVALLDIIISIFWLKYNYKYWFIIIFWVVLYLIFQKKFLPKNTFTCRLLSENSLAIKIITIFSIANLYIPLFADQLFFLCIFRYIIIIFVQYIFTNKIDIKTMYFTLLIVIFTTYLPIYFTDCIPYIWFFVLFLNSFNIYVDNIFIDLCKPINVNTRSTTNKDTNTHDDIPINTIIRRNPTANAEGDNTQNQDVYRVSMEIYNKTPYMNSTQQDIDIANKACEHVNHIALEAIIQMAEKEIKPILLSHKQGVNIDLTYIQQAVLKSIVEEPGEEYSNKKNLARNRYGGTINSGNFTLVGKNSLSFTGPTGRKTLFFELFENRVDDIKNGRFDPRKH